MGYHTDFTGCFKLDRPLTQEQADYINKFGSTRRMKRKTEVAEALPDPARLAIGLPIGDEGSYFVGGIGLMGQDDDESVIDHNRPPQGQPGLWCQWRATEDHTGIEWDGGEKFYAYVEWITYLINHFLKPWGRVLDGEIRWDGEEQGDIGKIVITNNKVSVKKGRVTFD